MEKFIPDFDANTRSVILEARTGQPAIRDSQRTVNDYIILRRDTSGALPIFSFLGLGLHIPNEVFDNPVIENAADFIAITNVSHFW